MHLVPQQYNDWISLLLAVQNDAEIVWVQARTVDDVYAASF